MSSSHCFKERCNNKLYGKCQCEANVVFCFEHGYEHLLSPNEQVHQVIRLYFNPPSEIKESVLKRLIEIIQEIKSAKKKSIENANEFIRKFQISFGEYYEKVKKIEKNCQKMIEILNSNKEIPDTAGKNSIEYVLKMNLNEANRKMSQWNS